jgi:TetR/AcrR family transcriptional regulator, fatty acid metabolism regulator protein
MASQTAQSAVRTRRGEDRRREILDVARQVFSSKGYEQTSMAEIAAQVGIVEGALYKHFTSKRELLFEAMRFFYEPLLGLMREQLASITGTRNRLRFVIAAQLHGFVKHPGLCRVIILEIRPNDDYQGSVMRKLNREMTSFVPEIIEEAVKAGELRGDIRATLVRDVVFGGIEHLAWKTLAGRETLDVQREADALTDLVLRGLEPRPGTQDAPDPQLARLRAQIDRLESLVGALALRSDQPAKKRTRRSARAR